MGRSSKMLRLLRIEPHPGAASYRAQTVLFSGAQKPGEQAWHTEMPASKVALDTARTTGTSGGKERA